MEPRKDATWITSLLAGAALWEIAGRLLDSRFPPFSAVVRAVIELTRDGALFQPLATSLGSLALGLTGAAVVGMTVGLLMARSYVFEHMFGIYFDALMSAPTLIYVPVFFALFGISRGSQVAVVFAYAFFVIAATTNAGVRGVDKRLIEMARAFGASERQIFWRVALPAARPLVLTGLRLGTTRAVKGMIVGEMIIALSGLGAMLKSYGAQFDMTGVLAVLLVIVIVSVTTNALVGALGRRLV
jgi:ABC-type nitrate/sulfonate/bicarbonate transport system permease component